MNKSIIRIGPAGVGPTKDIIRNLEEYSKLNLKAAEIEFTYTIYISEKDTKEIRECAQKNNIKLSIHAPYFINLNSEDPEKIESSKKRILHCCEIGNLLGAKQIVFHSGFYSKNKPKETYENIKMAILEIQDTIKKNKWDVELAPEIMGKINVFGSIDEISKLTKETGCSFTIDFAHILARYKENMLNEVIESFPQKNWHCHFSGIEYTEKGEKKHIPTNNNDWKNLLSVLLNLDKKITIINESPIPIDDAINGVRILEKIS